MPKIIRQKDYQAMPWKNGLGTTREIHCERSDGRVVWRLSLAQVNSDGLFSNFAGMERILTVVQGQGMRLVGEAHTYVAQPFVPVAFSGDERITGYCNSLPIENFNLIYDSAAVVATVFVVEHPADALTSITADATVVIHVISGRIGIDGGAALEVEDSCIMSENVPVISVSKEARCAVVVLTHR